MPRSQEQDTVELASEPVLELTIETLMEHLEPIVKSDESTVQDICRCFVTNLSRPSNTFEASDFVR